MWEDAFDTRYASTAGRDVLLNAPRVAPQPEQVDLVKRALAVAVRAGLRHLPSRIRFTWHAGGDASENPGFGLQAFDAPRAWSANGVTVFDGENGTIRVHLNTSISQRTLARTVFHELQHADDFASGRHRDLDRPSMEERAETFAARAFAMWDRGERR